MGDFEAADENKNGTSLHQLLVDCDLAAPATMGAFHQGKSTTWVSSTGNEHRLDYVLLQQSWRAGVVATWVMEEIDMGGVKDDHFPTAARISLIHERGPPVRRRRVGYDRKLPGGPPQAGRSCRLR